MFVMQLIIHTLIDTLQMIPWLLVIYILIGFLEYRYGDRLGSFVARLGFWGPLAGAVLGCLPQCGFSVVASALYVKRLVSVGTLMAVYLSTSDEAIPVLFSMPRQAHIVGLLIGIKLCVAFVVGTTIDFLIHRKSVANNAKVDADSQKVVEEHHGCCNHGVTKKDSVLKILIVHPLWHTLKIALFIFVMTLCLDLLIHRVGIEKISQFFSLGIVLQSALAALIGSIPNCFPSVFLVQLFDKDFISFGSLVAGLCCSSGLGPLVLIKENKDSKNTCYIIAVHLGISILLGILIQYGVKYLQGS